MKSEERLNPHYDRDLEVMRDAIERFLSGEMPETDFKRLRLKHGIYGQRQPGFQMVRIKIPSGDMTPEQMYLLAGIADEFANGLLHITTRQDVQLHWVKLENVPEIMRRVNEAGLTTREACGDTVRNITCCYLSGVCPKELFNVVEVSEWFSKFLLGRYVDLPRKFKLAFSGCERDCALTPFHDLGFIAKVEDGKAGFLVLVGGGQGGHPRLGNVLREFIGLEEAPLLALAVLEVFDEWGERRHKGRARLKFLVERLGFERFKELVEEKFETLKGGADVEVPDVELLEPVGGDIDFGDLIEQRQEGHYTIPILLRLGNITSGKFRALADIAKRYGLEVRANQDQNIVLMGVKREDIEGVKKGLEEGGLYKRGAGTYLDLVSCPGTETCGLGITSSRNLSTDIINLLPTDEGSYRALRDIRIRVSGCPNACAQHHASHIGLHGVAKKIGDRLAPHYVFHIGGGIDGKGARVGTTSLKIPARNAPDAVRAIIDLYLKERRENQSFYSFVDGVGMERIEKVLTPFLELLEGREYFKDFGSDKEFSLEDMGVGECAGVVADMVETSLREAKRLLSQAESHIKKGIPEDARAHIERALELTCEGLLVPFGIKAEGKMATEKFIEHVIGRRLVDERFIGLLSDGFKDVKDYYSEALPFIYASETAYQKLKLETERKKAGKIKDKARKEFLDLRGVGCPLNFVRAKQKLKDMDIGSLLVLTIDDEESLRTVPASLRDAGHEVIEIDQQDSQYVITVRRR